MPKVTVYLADELYDDMRESMNGEGTSKFIQAAVTAKLEAERPRCDTCDKSWPRAYVFCPSCAGELSRVDA